MSLIKSYSPLQAKLNYSFQKTELLRQALTHRSFALNHNERLEFMGDGVLNFVMAAMLFDHFPHLKEGDLSRIRAHLVRQETLVEIALQLNLAQYLSLGEGEKRSGGLERPSILADCLEAIFGAIFLDGGFDQVQKVISALFNEKVTTLDPLTAGKDAKTQLQEHLQSQQLSIPKYIVLDIQGQDHNQTFTVQCLISELDIKTQGVGRSKRQSEQEAALEALPLVISRLKE